MARFIAERRKTKKITQKQLAEHLGITDKAVSKWERGLSCPDISLLSELAAILEVSTSELLNGETADLCKPDPVDHMVEAALAYANTVTKNKVRNIRLVSAVVISLLSLLGMIVCVICNLALTGRLSWAWFPISSLIYLWLIVMPVVLRSRRGIFFSLIAANLFTLPFLFALEKIIGTEGLILPLGVPVFGAAILYLWIVYLLINKTKWPNYSIAAAALIAGLPLTFSINVIISKQTGEPVTDSWDILAYLILTILAAIIFGCGYAGVKNKRQA